MKSKQVLSIEQMKNLQKLGLDTSDASMVLIAIDDDSCPLDWETALEAMSTHLYDVSFDLFDADLPYYDHSYRKKMWGIHLTGYSRQATTLFESISVQTNIICMDD